jgi:AraC-like DNA-binding protein
VTGSARLSFEPGTSIDLQVGDYALVAPQLPHQLQSLQPKVETLVGRATYGLNIVNARPLFRSLPPVMVLQGRSDITQKHRALARLIVELHNESELGNKALVNRLIESAFILSVLTHRREQELGGHSLPIDPNTLRIAPSLHAMHRHPEKHWTLAKLAKESGLSRSLFCAEFAKATGETPTRYLSKIRLDRASELLRHSSLAIATIASHVGYGDSVTLGRAFKRHFGLSLSAFRNGQTIGG